MEERIKDPRKDDDRAPIDHKALERERRSADRNPDLRPPINRHAHDDRSHRG